MSKSKGMTREQKWSVVILSFGTFLEYFDLMLYIHMSVLLNDLFFPQTNPTTAQLLGATAFCTTYLLRPVGGFLIGKIGDAYGRKATITLTTFVMATACLIMAFTPEYKEIGITATIMIIVARMLQGFSSLGEIAGVQLYLTETLKIPYRCMAGGITGLAAKVGGLFALIATSVVLSSEVNWRYAFIFGAFIAVIGVFVRLRLRETSEFVDYQSRLARKIKQNKQDLKVIKSSFDNEKVNRKTILAFAFTEFHPPICLYIAVVYLRDFMKGSFGMTSAQVTSHNLKVLILSFIGALIIVYLVKRIHPVKIAMFTALIFVISLPFIPYWLDSIGNSGALFSLLCMQSLVLLLAYPTHGTLDAIQYKYFPIGKRFTSVATTRGFASPLGYALASLGLIPLTHYFGYYALWFVFTPAVIGYLWALYYFRKLEIERGLYYNYPCEPKPAYEDTGADELAYNYDLGSDYNAFKGKCEYSAKFLDKVRELNKDATRKVNIKLVEKAIVFAKKWHATQVRKTGEPFYHHPIAVADIISDYYFKTDVLVACVLHDVVEDDETKQCTVELIEKEFNARIAQMVEGLTKNKKIDGKEKIFTLKETLEDLHQRKDYETILVKNIDRTHNMQTAEGLKPEKRRKMAIETTRDMLSGVAPVAEKLNIEENIELEEKLFKLTSRTLREDE